MDIGELGWNRGWLVIPSEAESDSAKSRDLRRFLNKFEMITLLNSSLSLILNLQVKDLVTGFFISPLLTKEGTGVVSRNIISVAS